MSKETMSNACDTLPPLQIKECESGGPSLYSYCGEWWYDTKDEAVHAVRFPGEIYFF